MIRPIPVKGWLSICANLCRCYVGYVVLRTLTDKSAETMARALWGVITEYETMKILQSDNGLEFVNTVIAQMVKLY